MSASSFPGPGDIHSHPDAELEEIKRSSAWRLVRSLWRLRLWFVPHGGMREVALVWAKWAIATVGSEGPIRMLREAKPTMLVISERIRRDRTASFAMPGDSPRRIGRWYPTPRCFRILIVNGVPDTNVSARYRVFNPAEALLLAGIHTSAINEADLPRELPLVLEHDLLVLFRVKWDDRIEQLVSVCHECNIPVVFDIDDYLFDYGLDPERYAEIVPGWSEKELAWYVDMVLGYHRTLQESDFFTGSTRYLVQRASALGKESFVIRNGLSWELIEITHRLRLARRAESNNDTITIVYLSGTMTHERDFSTVVPSLVRILEERPKVELMIVGHLNLSRFSELKPYRDRINSHPFVPWRELPGLIAEADINVAPLELSVPFSDAKSELKYFEAGAMELVTVASATDTYERAIKDGETGLLCRTSQDWYRALSLLIENPAERARLAESAFFDSMAAYSPAAVAAEAEQTYKTILTRYRELNDLGNEQLQVGWVLSGNQHSHLWYERIFMVANEISKRGHGVALFFDVATDLGDGAAIGALAEYHLGEAPSFQIVLGTETIWSCDALIATDYLTANFANEKRDRAFLPALLVQDFAPQTSGLAAESFETERIFRSDLFFMALGEPLAGLIQSCFGIASEIISHWINRNHFFPRRERSTSGLGSKVLFYVPTAMSGMSFWLGIRAFTILVEQTPEVEIVVMSEISISGGIIDLPYQEIRAANTMERGELFREVDLCVTASSPILSAQIYEMMACGLPVMDLQADFTDGVGRSDRSSAVSPRPEHIAQQLSSLLGDDDKRRRMSETAIERASHVLDQDTALGQFVDLLEAEVRARDELARPNPQGQNRPVNN